MTDLKTDLNLLIGHGSDILCMCLACFLCGGHLVMVTRLVFRAPVHEDEGPSEAERILMVSHWQHL